MRVCYFGTYRAHYSRNTIMVEGLRRNGVEVLECHESLWRGIDDRVAAAAGGWMRPAFLWRLLTTYVKLTWRYLRLPQHDLVVVGYPGQLDVFLARLLTALRRKPLVWDVFMSIYLIALERELDQKSRFTVQALLRFERAACRLPNLLILDTAEYVAWFGKVHGVSPDRFRLVPTGADNRAHRPSPLPADKQQSLCILYYGTFIRNHGVEWIIEAARLLHPVPSIQFELIGEGPERDKAVALAEHYGLANVTFIPWLDKPQLQAHIEHADICLGVFGATPQSLMTVQNKIYEGMAAGRPVVTGDAPAIRKVFRHGEHLFLVKRGSGEALAEGLLMLAGDPALRHKIALHGHAAYMAGFTVERIGERFAEHLQELVEM